MNTYDNKQLTTSDKWRLTGHLFFTMGTLCLSVSSLIKLAQTGELSETGPNITQNTASIFTGRNQASDFFRRP